MLKYGILKKQSKMLIEPHLLTQACEWRCEVKLWSGEREGVESAGKAKEFIFDQFKFSLIQTPLSPPIVIVPSPEVVSPAPWLHILEAVIKSHLDCSSLF